MTDTEPLEYVLYLRKSNGRKAVPRQRAITTGYVKRQGGVILREFSDADRTAFRKVGAEQPVRDDFARMLALLRTRRGLRVAAWHADRLTRNDTDTAELIRVCAEGGHIIETPNGEVYDLSTANGRKRLRDDASDAEYEVDHGRERVLAARDEIEAEGRWLGGKRPFGWELDENPMNADGTPMLDEDGEPVNGILRLVEAEAKAVADASAAVIKGASTAGIARQWNAAGLTGTQGGKWEGKEVRRVLMRPRNAGLMERGGKVTGKASWPAIVDEDTWRAVCAKLSDPDRKTTPGPEVRHLLSHIARCGVCGGPMIASITRDDRRVYRCRAGAKGEAGHVSRDADTLEDYVSGVVIERLSRTDAKKLLVRPQEESSLPELYRQRATLEAAMKSSNQLRREGLLTPEEFRQDRADHQAKAADLAERITAAEEVDILAPVIEDPANVWKTLRLEQKRAVIRRIMTVTVHRQGKGRPKGWTPGSPYFDPEAVKFGPPQPRRLHGYPWCLNPHNHVPLDGQGVPLDTLGFELPADRQTLGSESQAATGI